MYLHAHLMLIDIFPPSFDCSNSLDKFINPLLNLISKNSPSPLGPLIDECHIKGLQRILFYEHQGSVQLRNFIEMLCQELESLVRGLEKNLVYLETEVKFAFGLFFFFFFWENIACWRNLGNEAREKKTSHCSVTWTYSV